MTNGKAYEAVMISFDGKGYVTDYTSKTKEEVIEKLVDRELNRGWWINFHPYPFIIEYDPSKRTRDQKIVDTPKLFAEFKNKTVGRVMQFIRENDKYLSHQIDSSLQFVKEYKRRYKKKL